MNIRQLASRFSATGVAAIAAVASYSHMQALALDHGQTPLLAALVPLSVDGLVIVATVAIADGRDHKWSAWLSFVLGVAASISANVLAARPDLISRLISAWPSLALLAVVEMINHSGRSALPNVEPTRADVMNPGRTVAVSEISDKIDNGIANIPSAPRTPRRTPTVAAKVAAARAKMPDASPAAIAAKVGVSESTARRHGGRTVASSAPTEIAAKAGVTERTARRHLGASNLAEIQAKSVGTVPTQAPDIGHVNGHAVLDEVIV